VPKPIPDGYHAVTPYLVNQGVAKVIAFAKAAFGATVKEEHAGPNGTVMHAEIVIGDSIVMLGEAGGPHPPVPAMLYLYVKDVDETYRRAVAAGAVSVSAPADQFYGDRNAGVRDVAGNQWWIATHKEDVPPDELARRAQAFAAKKKA
jgi:uncharacterized glyoxalase superfamily protein PhnB